MSNAVLSKPVNTNGDKLAVIDSKDSMNVQFAKWLYKETMGLNKIPNGKIISIDRCATKINQLRGNDDANLIIVRSWISHSREYFENNLNCTIWPVYGRGWRASTEIETAKYCGKSIRKTMAWCERTRRLYVITNPKHLNYMIREVAQSAGKKISNLAIERTRFLEMWGAYAKEEEKQLEGKEQKLISAPPQK